MFDCASRRRSITLCETRKHLNLNDIAADKNKSIQEPLREPLASSLRSDKTIAIIRRTQVSATYDENVSLSEAPLWKILSSWEEEEGHQRACWSAAHKGEDISAFSSPPVNIEATCIPGPRRTPTFLSVISLVLVPVVIITALPHNRTHVATNVQRMPLSTSQESDSYYLHFLYFSNALRQQECGKNSRSSAFPTCG